jgi:hypothetical protein
MKFMIKPWAISSLTLLTGVGAAIAQDAPAAPAAPREVSGGQDVNLTPQQMLTRVKAYVPEMDQARVTVSAQLADATNKRDVVRSLCLDDKLKQMKLATDTAKDRTVDLTAAVSQNDQDRTKHEFTVIQVLRERVQTLVAEAQQCIGEETGFVGNTDIIVDIDPAIPNTDPSESPEDPMVSEPPVLSSPTL